MSRVRAWRLVPGGHVYMWWIVVGLDGWSRGGDWWAFVEGPVLRVMFSFLLSGAEPCSALRVVFFDVAQVDFLLITPASRPFAGVPPCKV